MKKIVKKHYIIICLVIVAVSVVTLGIAISGPDGDAASRKALELLKEGQDALDNDSLLVAFGKLQQAVTEFRELNDSDKLFESVVYLSMLYDQIGQKEEAYGILRTVPFRDVGNYESYSSQYYLRLMAYYSALLDHDYLKGEEYTKMAVDFSRSKYPDDKSYVYMDMANLAEMYIMSDQPEKAWQVVHEVSAYDSIDYRLYLSELHYCTGLLYDRAGKADSAYAEFNKSLVYSRRHKAIDNELNALAMLSRADSAAGRLIPYIEHRNAFDSLKARQNGNEMYYRLAVLREQHKAELLMRQSEEALMKHRLWLCLLLFVILLIAAGFALVYKGIKAKQKLAAAEKERLDATIEMEKLEKELLQLKIENRDRMLNKANRENLAISLKLAEAGDKSEPSRITPLVHTLKEMDNSLIEHLEQAYPTLSKNDMRLVGMIRSGMASDEIAAVLNISTDSINKSRYRLRKKLGLAKGENLEAFLKNFV